MRRSLHVIESAQAGRVVYDGRSVIMLSSNNYLGLAAHPRVKQAAVAATERYGVGSGASRLVAGNLCIDCDGQSVAVGGNLVTLTHQEFELLTLLVARRDEIIDRRQLSAALWGDAGPREFKRLTVVVGRLRDKLVASDPYAIETVRCRGYGLVSGRGLPGR